MFMRQQVSDGMTVRSTDGEKLGRVFAVGDEAFHIEKGLFFPKDYLVRYADIQEIRDGEIILAYGRDSLSRLSNEDAPLETRSATSAKDVTTVRNTEQVAIPLYKEELDVTKRSVDAGEVRIHKDVVEEMRTVSVPVRHESVRIEHRAASPDQPAPGATFQEETVVVPLHAEQLDIQKHAVLDEEVIIHKDVVEEERRVAESVRHEEVDIRSPDDESRRSLSLDPDKSSPRRS